MYRNIDNFPVVGGNIVTRSFGDIRTEYNRLTIARKSIIYDGPSFWNSLPDNLKTIDNLNSFKKMLKTRLLSRYASQQN